MAETKKQYGELLRDPRWQKKRLEVMHRDDFTCIACGRKDKTLNVNHLKYSGAPWEVDVAFLETLCEDCHRARTMLDKQSDNETRSIPTISMLAKYGSYAACRVIDGEWVTSSTMHAPVQYQAQETRPVARRPTFRKLTGVQVSHVESVLLAYVLRDTSGSCVRLLLEEAGDLPWSHPAAERLLEELRAWAAQGAGQDPATHVQSRWHAHDAAYRAYVIDLLDKDILEGGETERAVRESLGRLRLAKRAHHG